MVTALGWEEYIQREGERYWESANANRGVGGEKRAPRLFRGTVLGIWEGEEGTNLCGFLSEGTRGGDGL